MFRFSNQLLFPTLKIVERSLDDTGNNIFCLDWKYPEALKEKKWVETTQSDPTLNSFIGSIPEEYSEWLDSLRFSIPSNYIDEIRHCSFKALEETIRRKPESRWEPQPTRGPAATFIQKAFILISDCLYDPTTHNYSRDERKNLVPYALTFKFWCHQTKVDNLFLYSGISDLKSDLNNFFNNLTDEGCSHYTNFIDSIEKHVQRMKNNNQKDPREIIPGTLIDVIGNKRSTASVNRCSIPGLNLNLTGIKIYRKGKLFLMLR